jgi:hypothetical protein
VKQWMRTALTITSLSVSTWPCHAEQEFWQGQIPPSRAVRTRQAREWLEGFKKLDEQIPTLSVHEREWLEREYDNQIATGKYTRRALEGSHSVEYHKRTAREKLDRILESLDLLVNARSLTTEAEVEAWVKVASAMIDPDLWQAVTALVERKAVSPEINGVKQFYLENHLGWAQAILDRVIMQYFTGRLKVTETAPQKVP